MEGRFGQVGGGEGIRRIARQVLHGVGDVLFPHFCLACDKEGSLFCRTCEIMRNAPMRGVFYCVGCGKEIRNHAVRGRRGGAACLDAARGFAAGRYADPVMRGLLHLYKYGRVEEAGAAVERFLAFAVGRQAAGVLAGLDDPLVIPMPMNRVNRAVRGFNQCERLAEAVAAELELETSLDAVARRFSWRAQANIVSEARRGANVRGVFLPGKGSVAGRDVLLVDDVFTTGATVRECLRTLHQMGAGRIAVVTALKG